VADVLCVAHADAEVEPRMHDRVAITLVPSAATVRCESSRSLVAARNSVLLVPAKRLYSWRARSRPTSSCLTLLVGDQVVGGLEAIDPAAVVTDAALVDQLSALANQLLRPAVSLECASALRAVLGRLAASAVPVGITESRQGTPLGAARDYLQDHVGEPVTITALADMIGLAESHFIRAFHREFGLPPHAYHLRLRLAAASELLASGLSVSTVAYECGFADQSHLSRNFKAVYGLTPAAWTNAVSDSPRRSARPTLVEFPAIASRSELRIARVMNS
jgi:AraC-like DNA-binding protein